MLIFAILSEVPFDLALVSGTVWDYSHQNVFFTLFLGLSFIFLSDYVKNKENPNGYLKFMGHLGSLFAGCVAAQAIYDSSISAAVSGAVAYLMEYAGKSAGNIEKYITIGLSLEAFLITAIIYLFKSMKFDENKRIYVANSLFFLCITMGIADLLNTDYSAWGVLVVAIMYAFKDKKVKEAALGCLGLTIMQFIEATSFLILIPVSMYNGKRGLKLKYFFYFFYPVHLTLLWLLGLLIY